MLIKFLHLILLVFFVSIKSTAQHPTDFYVALSKSQSNDTLYVFISVQKHQNISYETFNVEIKAKGEKERKMFQISNRFPYGIVNDLNMYKYQIPFKSLNGMVYEVVINNQRLCNIGPFKIEEVFSSDNVHTFSYANPGYKLIQPVKLK